MHVENLKQKAMGERPAEKNNSPERFRNLPEDTQLLSSKTGLEWRVSNTK